jgi:DNA-binding GntR family transcriptional regulator
VSHGDGKRADASLTDRAYRELEELIVTLELPPGSFVSEQALSQRLGIGRTPIREALHRLTREGLIVVLPRRGILVADINVAEQLELLRVRREIERLMARLAATRATPDERAMFHAIAEDMRVAAQHDDDVAFMRLDRELNVAVSTVCRNVYARNAMVLMHGLSRRFWYRHYKQVLDMPLCARLHADLAGEIADGDPARAAAASDALLDYIATCTRATVDCDLVDAADTR